MKAIVFVTMILVAWTGVHAAPEYGDSEAPSSLKAKARAVQHLALNPVVLKFVRRQNDGGLSMETIKERDRLWRNSGALNAMKRSHTNSPAGRFLRRAVEGDPAVYEAFIADNQGANVAAYPETGAYWHGNSDVWRQFFVAGRGKVFISSTRKDERLQAQVAHVSAPVINGGETIGVLVVGLRLDKFAGTP